MVFQFMRYVIVLLVGIMGFVLVNNSMPVLAPIIDVKFLKTGVFGISLVKLLAMTLGGLFGALIGYVISAPLLHRGLALAKYFERLLSRVPSQELVFGTVGLLFGLIIANLIGVAFYRVPYVGTYIPIALSAICGYIGMHLMSRKGYELYDGFRANWTNFRHKEDKHETTESRELVAVTTGADEEGTDPFSAAVVAKLVDTSAIIDGRIEEISKTGFLEGPLVVPVFVLEELQHISDSADTLKRSRGRRGLDILKAMQQAGRVSMVIIDDDFEDISEVDSKLMRLALERHWKIITNDLNLNKVAAVQGIIVLNVNDLANSLKPTMVAGERLVVHVVKEGKESKQGIAYLDDGTMIVIENGSPYIDQTITVVVSSVLQTSAGRMIFARAEEES